MKWLKSTFTSQSDLKKKKKKEDYRGCLPVCSSLFGVRLIASPSKNCKIH